MRDVITDIDRWLAAGDEEIAIATVIQTWGSAPRKTGAKMAFTANGAIAGSVSGGCVEGAVIEASEAVWQTGESQLLHFGVADETAWDVGLACGGTIDVLVEPLDRDIYAVVRASILAEQPVAIVTVLPESKSHAGMKLVLEESDPVGGTLPSEWHGAAASLVAQTAHSTRTQLAYQLDVFVDQILPAPRIMMVGGAHIAVALARLATVLGYATIVIDPRRAFGSIERFPGVDELVQAWPAKAFADHPVNSETAVVTLSHDPKIDDPALSLALHSPAFYIGALGSKRTHARRRDRLAEQGFRPQDLERIHAPIGLDIGADNPEEIALAIMAEIVQAYRQR